MTRLATEVAESSHEPERGRAAGWRPALLVAIWYLLGGFFVTSRMWLNPVGLRQNGDIQDVNQATWFVRYAEVAVRHFRLPALTTVAMNAPHGVNLMWNTSFLLPGVIISPVTALFGPQVALTTLLVLGFAGSALAMYYVLRHWQASYLAAALGGALYGFSPALVDSGIGHYSLVLAMLPPLIVDRVARLVTRQGGPVRNGIWLGLLVAGQLFISEESLVDTVIATVILLVVLALSRPREVLNRIPPLIGGLAVGGVVALVLSARGLWVQFHGVATKTAAATVVIQYHGQLTNLGTLPSAFVVPSTNVLLHTPQTGAIANNYPQPLPEYLAYLGVILIPVLLIAIVRFWKVIPIRVAGITFLVLEWLGMGSAPIRAGVLSLPSSLLPWRYIEHLPVLGGMVSDRLCILADAGAAVVLALALDRARSGEVAPFSRWRHGSAIATGIAVIALLPIIPAPYGTTGVNPLPAGWTATFKKLDLPSDARVLLAPFPWSGTSQVMRWQAVSGYPRTMIGGDFIAPGHPGRQSRAGRAGMTPTSYYIDYLFDGASPTGKPLTQPSAAQISKDLNGMKPNAVVAFASPGTRLSRFLIRLFGQPTVVVHRVMGWKLKAGWQPPSSG